jgi:sugar lactone lactonase YvrE
LADRVNERLVELAFDWDGTVGYAENRFRMVRSIDLVAWTKARLPDAEWTLRPDDLWFDGEQLHFVDARNALVGVFDARWRPTLLADASIGLSAPTQVRKDPDGRYVILDANRRALFGLDQEESLLQTIFTGIKEPGGFVFQSDGTLFVTDRAEDELVRIQSDGRSVFAQTGSDHGELWQPAGLAVAPDGRLLVMDVGNHRAQAFDAQGDWCLTFGTGRAVTPKTRNARRPSLSSEE